MIAMGTRGLMAPMRMSPSMFRSAGRLLKFRSLPKSVAGRIVLGVAAFALLAAVGGCVRGCAVLPDARCAVCGGEFG